MTSYEADLYDFVNERRLKESRQMPMLADRALANLIAGIAREWKLWKEQPKDMLRDHARDRGISYAEAKRELVASDVFLALAEFMTGDVQLDKRTHVTSQPRRLLAPVQKVWTQADWRRFATFVSELCDYVLRGLDHHGDAPRHAADVTDDNTLREAKDMFALEEEELAVRLERQLYIAQANARRNAIVTRVNEWIASGRREGDRHGRKRVVRRLLTGAKLDVSDRMVLHRARTG